MFHDLDSTVKELLRRTLPPDLVQQVALSFAAPDSRFPPSSVTLPALDLFLYDLGENVDLRSLEPMLDRQDDGSVVRVPAPVRVDCHYLITAWPRAGDQSEQDEHRILGEAMRALARYREIPREVLQGSMKDQPAPLRAFVLRTTKEQGRGDFWQALGGKPKAAFDYCVTIAVDTGPAEAWGAPVTIMKI